MNINGENVRDCKKEDVAVMLQGRAGSTVDVDVLRDGNQAPIRITLVRNYDGRSGAARKTRPLDSNKQRAQITPPSSSNFGTSPLRYQTPADPTATQQQPSVDYSATSEKSFGHSIIPLHLYAKCEVLQHRQMLVV